MSVPSIINMEKKKKKLEKMVGHTHIHTHTPTDRQEKIIKSH